MRVNRKILPRTYVSFAAGTIRFADLGRSMRSGRYASEHMVDDLAELDRIWSKDLEPSVVSGTSHCEVYRVL
jgi:hypothetical protein